nr:MAG TPA: hypothetical protein [Caudoviricetes sp.]
MAGLLLGLCTLRRRARRFFFRLALRRDKKLSKRLVRQKLRHVFHEFRHRERLGVLVWRGASDCGQDCNDVRLVIFQKCRERAFCAICKKFLCRHAIRKPLTLEKLHCFAVLCNIRDRLDDVCNHVKNALTLDFRKPHSLLLFLRRVDAVKKHRHRVLRLDGHMAGQFHGDLALAVFRRLKRETARRKRIFELDCDDTAIRAVADPPNIGKVRLFKVVSWGNFAGRHSVDVCRAERHLDVCRRRAKRRKAHFALPPIKVLQLFHIVGAVVHVVAHVRVGRDARRVDSTSCRADDCAVIRGRHGRRVKCFKQDTGVELEALKSVLRDYSKFTHCKLLSVFRQVFNCYVDIPAFDITVALVHDALAPGRAALDPDIPSVARKYHAAQADRVRHFLRFCIRGSFSLCVVPKVYCQPDFPAVKRAHRKLIR